MKRPICHFQCRDYFYPIKESSLNLLLILFMDKLNLEDYDHHKTKNSSLNAFFVA
jgi:hypothetical protein